MPADPEKPPEPKSRRDKSAPHERKPLPDKKADEKDDAAGTPEVRVAGRKQMRLPPEDWDEVDEEGDESFPASDPPGNY